MFPLINQVQRSTTHSLLYPFCFRFAASLLRLVLRYEWLGTWTSQTSSRRGFYDDSHNTCPSQPILSCLSILTPCGLRARPEYKRPVYQRTLPHLKGWNLLDLYTWMGQTIFGCQRTILSCRVAFSSAPLGSLHIIYKKYFCQTIINSMISKKVEEFFGFLKKICIIYIVHLY